MGFQPHVLTDSTSAASRRGDAPLRASGAPPWGTAAPCIAWSVGSGLALGTIAALADARGGWLADALSMPGPWIAATGVVALVAARRVRPWIGAAATAVFLVAGIAAYYLAKQWTTGAVPGPLVVFWGVLAVAVGLALGRTAAWLDQRPWGTGVAVGAVAGWLVVEAIVVPSAPAGEALAGMAGVGFAARANAPEQRRVPALGFGFVTGAGSAACVFAVLSRALSAAL